METVTRFVPEIDEAVYFSHGGKDYSVDPGEAVESEEIAIAAESVRENERKKKWLGDNLDSLYIHFEEIQKIVEQGGPC